MATTTGISISEDLLEQIDQARRLEELRTGERPSRSAWLQQAARAHLEGIDQEQLQQVQDLADSLA